MFEASKNGFQMDIDSATTFDKNHLGKTSDEMVSLKRAQIPPIISSVTLEIWKNLGGGSSVTSTNGGKNVHYYSVRNSKHIFFQDWLQAVS